MLVIHLSWRDVLTDLRDISVDRRGQERMWLDQLTTYLRRVVQLRSIADSWTYCVVLNDERPGDGGEHTFREFVTDDHAYFHPYGIGGWPTEPPNFMAFRWQGAVRRIHRVIRADVLPSLLDRWPDIPATEGTLRPHAVYDLGPHSRLPSPFPAGRPTAPHAYGYYSINFRRRRPWPMRWLAARASPAPAERKTRPFSPFGRSCLLLDGSPPKS